MKSYTLKVEEIRKETEDAITLCFKQPGLKKIKYRAGQYLTLQFRINGRRYIRPYSFSSAPIIDSTLNITVKRVPEGIVSNYINDHVKIGDLIEVQEPMGDFVFEPSETIGHVVFWGVGSGITPLFSIIKQLLITQPLLKIYLVYGNKRHSSTIFLEELKKMGSIYFERFKIWNFYSKEEFINEKENCQLQGRINVDFINKLINKIPPDSNHYICGPKYLKDMVKEVLFTSQYPEKYIFCEDFELFKDPEDFKDINDENIIINFQGFAKSIKVTKGNSILEEALEIGLELPYSCQTGNCSTCKGRLISGEIKMIGLSNHRKDLEPNEYLLCCSYPLTNDVCINVE